VRIDRSHISQGFDPTLQIKYQVELVFQIRFSGSVRDNGRKADFSLFIIHYALYTTLVLHQKGIVYYLWNSYPQPSIVRSGILYAKNSPDNRKAHYFAAP
jgi:hypothetical protein